jgi:hypothetical protein
MGWEINRKFAQTCSISSFGSNTVWPAKRPGMVFTGPKMGADTKYLKEYPTVVNGFLIYTLWLPGVIRNSALQSNEL